MYIGTISPARDTSASYIAWGHSTVVNPWGEVVSTCEDEEAIVYADMGEYLFLYVQKLYSDALHCQYKYLIKLEREIPKFLQVFSFVL